MNTTCPGDCVPMVVEAVTALVDRSTERWNPSVPSIGEKSSRSGLMDFPETRVRPNLTSPDSTSQTCPREKVIERAPRRAGLRRKRRKRRRSAARGRDNFPREQHSTAKRKIAQVAGGRMAGSDTVYPLSGVYDGEGACSTRHTRTVRIITS